METVGTGPAGPEVGGRRFAGLMDRWRRSLGLRDSAFAASLGLSKSGWSHLKHGTRPVPWATAGRVLRRAEEPWRSGFEKALAADAEAHTPDDFS